jgi:hypothetical protein
MASPARKKATARESPRRSRTEGAQVSPGRSEVDPASLPEQGLIAEIRIEAGAAFSPATRLRVRGLNVLAQAAAPEKEKVSITLDKPLVDEIRAQFGGRALSTSINELLYAALAQERLAQLVDEMEQEAGPPSLEAYERVLSQWFAEG